MRTLIRNGHVYTVNTHRDVFPDGFVVIGDDRVEAVGPGGAEPDGAFDRVIDASGMIVIPGLINMHQHPWMNLLKGLADGLVLEPWVFKFVQPFLNVITVDDLRASASLSALEMLRTGTTCALDHTTRLPDGYEAALIEPMAQAGIRHVFAKLFMCRTPKLPDFPLSASEAKAQAAELVEKYDGANGGLTRMALAIECNAHHTELGKSSDELVRVGYELACEKDLRVPVHASGGSLSMSMGFLKYLRLTGRRDVEYLETLGVLDHRWLLKHGIHFSDVDIETVKKRGASIVYTPTSEAIRGGGLGPWVGFQRAGINCALGTDGPAVDYSVDMVEQMKACLYLQNMKYRDQEAMTPERVLDMATINAARALGLDGEIGSLEPGKRADIAVFGLSEPHMQVIHDPLLNFVCCARGADAKMVFVDGRLVFDRGRFPVFGDIAGVLAEASARGQAIARQSGLDVRAIPRWPSAEPASQAVSM